MFDWIADRFSLNVWCAILDRDSGCIQLIGLDFDWHDSEAITYYSATVGLFGLCASLTYWPGGKYDDAGEAGA